MALIDKFLKKSLVDQESDQPLNILVCFSKPETGKSLCKVASYFMQSKIKNEQITSLHLLDKDEYDKIDNIETFKTSLYENIIDECKKGETIIRTFIKPSDDFVSEIISTSEELDSNLVLIGIGKTVFTPQLWGSYQKFRAYQGIPKTTEGTLDTLSHRGVSSLLERNAKTTGIFIDNNLETINQIFIPILDKADIHIFDYVKRLVEKTEAEITLWDAIGVIDSVPELKKVFQTMQKNADDRVSLWDNSKKIEYDFIKQQDLVITGFEGWTKLISSAITWSHSLPSTLIIRKKIHNTR